MKSMQYAYPWVDIIALDLEIQHKTMTHMANVICPFPFSFSEDICHLATDHHFMGLQLYSFLASGQSYR